MLNSLRALIIMSIMWSLSITLITNALPTEILESNQFSWTEKTYDFSAADGYTESVKSQVENVVEKERKAPFINTVTLIFYSGNLVIDLAINFVTALPSMATLLISTFTFIFNIHPLIATQIKIAVYSILTVSYLIGIIGILLSLRSGGVKVS